MHGRYMSMFRVCEKEIIFENIDELKIVNNMSERKKLLFELGDAYLALPGGTGTLEEIVEVVSWKVMRIHNKPIIFFNKNIFWFSLSIKKSRAVSLKVYVSSISLFVAFVYSPIVFLSPLFKIYSLSLLLSCVACFNMIVPAWFFKYALAISSCLIVSF